MANELAIVSTMDLDTLMTGSGMLTALREELGEDAQPSFAFAKMPSQGMTSWQIKVDEDDDDPEIVKSIEGVILLAQRNNAYWPDSIDNGGDRQPVCRSSDGLRGVDSEGCVHACAGCPQNKFGSDGKRGKACKNSVKLYILRDGLPLPMILHISSTGINPYNKYVENLLLPKKRGQVPMRPVQVVTRIGLKTEQNADGIKYSKPTFEAIGKLDDTTRDAVRCIADQLAEAQQQDAMKMTAVDDTPFD